MLNIGHYKKDLIIRWSLPLQGYDFMIKDIAGKENVMADYFSRMIIKCILSNDFMFCCVRLFL